MRQFSDDPTAWDSESAYMPLSGLGDTAPTTASAPTSWWQNLLQTGGQVYTEIKNAQTAAKTATQPTGTTPPAPGGGSSSNWPMYLAVGGGALLLGMLVFGKKRR